MQNDVPDYVKKDFGYITSIIHYYEKEEELTIASFEAVLEEYPKFNLGFHPEVIQKAYRVLQWAMEHPTADFNKLESWHFNDNLLYFEKMKILYEIMTKYKLYEWDNYVPDSIKQDIGTVTSIIYYYEKEADLSMESYEALLEEYPKFQLHLSLIIRQKAYAVLKWVMEHTAIDFSALDERFVPDNSLNFQKMKILYQIMTKYKLYE